MTFDRRTGSGAVPPEVAAVSQRLQQLCELPLFRDVAAEELLPLAETSESVAFGAGDVIVRQGDSGDSIYVIVRGRVEVLARVEHAGIGTESVVASLTDGDALGELSVLDGQPRSATCVAAVPTLCVRLTRDTLRAAMRRHWPLAEALLATLAERLRHADRVMAEHARDPLTGVYNRRALFELYEREARRAQRAAQRARGATHDDIAAAATPAAAVAAAAAATPAAAVAAAAAAVAAASAPPVTPAPVLAAVAAPAAAATSVAAASAAATSAAAVAAASAPPVTPAPVLAAAAAAPAAAAAARVAPAPVVAAAAAVEKANGAARGQNGRSDGVAAHEPAGAERGPGAVSGAPPPLAVLFVDVNKFKEINDTYGHKTGDEVLCAVARALSQCGRATDHVARYGGDEFVMLLPEGGIAGAQLVSGRLRRLLADTPPGPVPFSVSIGASAVEPIDPPPLEALMARADEEMYRDKARQR